MAQVQQALVDREAQIMKISPQSIKRTEHTPSALVNMGLELEREQCVHGLFSAIKRLIKGAYRRKLAAAVKKLKQHFTPQQSTRLTDTANSIRRRILAWRCSLEQHVPEAKRLFERPDKLVRDPTERDGPMDAYNEMIWLPSDMVDQGISCYGQLLEAEWDLRKGQADEALEAIRDCLMMHAAIRLMKIEYTQGVKEGTRSEARLGECMSKAHFCADTYRMARKAMVLLSKLLPAEYTGKSLEYFPALHQSDIRELPSGALELGDGYKEVEMSWIWKSYGSATGDKEAVNDGT
jgi:hypothetical protein